MVVVGDRSQLTGRDRIRYVAGMIALPVVYQLFRMGYFGSLVANTATAKEGTSARWPAGWNYLSDFVAPYFLWLPVGVLAAGAYIPILRGSVDRCRAVIGSFVIGAVVIGFWVVYVGGDYFSMPAC